MTYRAQMDTKRTSSHRGTYCKRPPPKQLLEMAGTMSRNQIATACKAARKTVYNWFNADPELLEAEKARKLACHPTSDYARTQAQYEKIACEFASLRWSPAEGINGYLRCNMGVDHGL